MKINEFYKGKRVFITGHTGFKGSWLCVVLKSFGAEVTGYSLPNQTEPSLFDIAQVTNGMNSILGDIRKYDELKMALENSKPEIVFHLAAQPLVRESYKNPVYTYETNVLGTVNLLECIRNSSTIKSFVNITTDKVYRNLENGIAFSEEDELDGYDPYSNSKSCSELVTHCYVRSFFKEMDNSPAVSTVRAGNVIGGGDYSENRIIPDCIRAAEKKEKIIIRNPYSVRPFQHVLEPLSAYMLVAQRQYEDKSFAGAYNVGPQIEDCITTGRLADIFVSEWGEGIKWENHSDNGPHEAGLLKLNCEKIKSVLGWKSKWSINEAVRKTVEWEKNFISGGNVMECMNRQIVQYFN